MVFNPGRCRGLELANIFGVILLSLRDYFALCSIKSAMIIYHPRRLLGISMLLAPIVFNFGAPRTNSISRIVQEPFPDSPDLTRVYYQNAQSKLLPLPFEAGVAGLNEFAVARKEKTSHVMLEGLRASTVIKKSDPRFYVFVMDKMDPPPHLLLQLESKNRRRRFTVISERGRAGFSPLATENIRLDYRILERLEVPSGKGLVLFINYLELRPRRRLQPGEYAILGNSLKDIATFRVE